MGEVCRRDGLYLTREERHLFVTIVLGASSLHCWGSFTPQQPLPYPRQTPYYNAKCFPRNAVIDRTQKRLGRSNAEGRFHKKSNPRLLLLFLELSLALPQQSSYLPVVYSRHIRSDNPGHHTNKSKRLLWTTVLSGDKNISLYDIYI